MGIMIMSVRDSIISIQDIEDPSVVWRMLRSLYEPRQSARKLMLNHKLYNMKMNMGTSVNDFIWGIKDVVTQLASVGEVIQEKEMVQVMLGALPNSSESFIERLLTQDQLPSFGILVGKLLLDETRREFKSGKRENEALMLRKIQWTAPASSNS